MKNYHFVLVGIAVAVLSIAGFIGVSTLVGQRTVSVGSSALQSVAPFSVAVASTATSSQVVLGTVNLQGIIVSSHTAATVTLYDNTSATGTPVVATYTFPTGSSFVNLGGVLFAKGVFSVVSSTASLTYLYTK